MKDHSTPLWRELTATGTESIAITPGAATVPGAFNISGVPAATDNHRNYVQGFWGHLTIVVDPDAAGSAISFDQLYKGMASWRVSSPLLGDVFSPTHTRGAVLGHIIQVLALGYQYPQPARAQIPASTDTDVTIDLFYWLPLSYEVLKKPHETAQWVGFFDGGTMEGVVDAATVYDADYAGAVTKTGTLRAYVEYLPSPDAFLGVPCQWRERRVSGGGSQPIIRNVGGETSLTGIKPGCGLAGLFWLSDAAGIGLGGPDGVDNITSVEIPWRGQQLLRNVDPYFLALRRATRHRVGPIAGAGAAGAALHDGAGWPYTMAATPNGRPGAQASAMFWPIIFPGSEFETSKAQRASGDLPINMNVTAGISAEHRFVTWELLEYTDDQVGRMAVAMLGNEVGLYEPNRKALNDNNPDPAKLRYTRIMFERRAR